MIKIYNLQKQYNKHLIIDIAFYHFEKGKTYLLIGENGSGKSTLIKLILGFIKPNQGQIKLSKCSLSYVPERVIFPEFISTKAFLENLLSIRGQSFNKIPSYLHYWSLNPNKKLNHLSKGMKQKLNLIQALISEADLFIFDEPLNGLDEQSQILFLNEIGLLRKVNKTVIVATHYPEIYNARFDKIISIKEGNLYESS